MTTLVLLPIALAIFLTGAGIAWPVAYRAGLQSPERAGELVAARLVERQPEPEAMGGYQARHRLGDEAVQGSSAQRARIGKLRSPTGEFEAIVATSYQSGELPLIGRPGMAHLRAHLAAVGS